MDPLIGIAVGRYQIDSVIGEGGMGRVYLAIQPEIGSRVAIKVLADQRPDLVERFFAEARAVNLIRHENIVSVIDLAQLDDGRAYIVMELVDGQTLGAATRGGTAPIGGVITALGEVLSALEAAHALGIVHRDIKPDNVLVTREGHAKVLDFGIAKLAAVHGTPRTQTGALLGTPAYMAPEQISGAEKVDARTDLYAVGVVLFECLTGRVPFEAPTLFDLMKAHVEAPVPPIGRADVPPSLEAIVQRAMAKDPAARFQSAAEMRRALIAASRDLPSAQWRPLSRKNLDARGGSAAGGQRGVIGLEPTLPMNAATLVERRRWPWAAGGIAVVGAIGALASLRGGAQLDAKHFDASAFLPTATARARAIYADAQLVRFDITGVRSDGVADLTLPAVGDSSYLFRSPSRSARPAVPANVAVDIACMVEVTVTADGIEVDRRTREQCDQPLLRDPVCTLAQVWALARLHGERRRDVVAKISFLGDGWYFDPDHGVTLPDSCGMSGTR